MKKRILFLAFAIMLAIPALVASAQNHDFKDADYASDYKVVWKSCPGGDPVIRCRPSGSGECYASWQDFC